MGFFKKLRKYVAPSKSTLSKSVDSVGQNLESAGKQIATSITDPSTEQGKKILAQVGGFVGASLGDPYAGEGIKNALNGNSPTEGVGGPVGLASRAIAADRAERTIPQAGADANAKTFAPTVGAGWKMTPAMAAAQQAATRNASGVKRFNSPRQLAAAQMLGDQV